MFVTRSELTSVHQPPIHSWWQLTLEAMSRVSGFVSVCADVYQGYSSCMVSNHITHISYFVIYATRRPRAHLMSFVTCFTPSFTAFTFSVSTYADLLHHFYYSQPVNSFIPLSPASTTPPTSWQVQLNYPFRPYPLPRELMSNYFNFSFSSSNYCFFIPFFFLVSFHILPILDNFTFLIV